MWRKSHTRDGLGIGGGLFDEEWTHGTEGRPPLRSTIPWLEAWDRYLETKETEGYVIVEE